MWDDEYEHSEARWRARHEYERTMRLARRERRKERAVAIAVFTVCAFALLYLAAHVVAALIS